MASSNTIERSPEQPAGPSEEERLTPGDVVQRLLELGDEGKRQHLIERALATLDHEDFLTFVRSEAERYFHVDPRTTLLLAGALICASDVAGRQRHHALGLMAKGDALRVLGSYGESLQYFEDAAREFLAQGDEVGWARTRIGWIVSLQWLGQATGALPDVDRAHAVLAGHGEWLRAGALDLNTALVYKEQGHYARALDLYDRALAAYAHLGSGAEARIARVLAMKAQLLTYTGDFQQSLALHEQARDVLVRHGDTVSVLQQDHNVALLYAGQGHYTRALHLYGETLASFEEAGLEVDAAWVALSVLECYLHLNRDAEAIDLAEETIQRFERAGSETEAARARLYAAVAHARLGETDRALALLQEAAGTFAGAGLIGHLGLATLYRASIFLQEADWPAALQEAGQARTVFTSAGLPVREAQAELVQARASLALADEEGATNLARAALEITQRRDVLWLDHEAHHVLASVAGKRGDLRTAIDEYQAATAAIERLQGQLVTELRSNFLADKLAVYHGAIDCSLRFGDADLAFSFLERAKSRALVDYLAANPEVRIRTRNAADQDLVDELSNLRAEHNWYYNQLNGYGPSDLSRDRTMGSDPEALRSAIQQREKRIAQVLERLALREIENREAIGLPDGSEHLRRPSLEQDTVLLEYYLNDGGGVVFVLSGNRLEAVLLPARVADIQRLLVQWYLNLDATARASAARQSLNALDRNARAILEALYRILLKPIEQHLAGRARLVVVPYGPTHWVPFHALHDGRRYLLEALEVSTCPSSSLLRLCAARNRAAGRGALVVAHSDGGRLPRTIDEARAISALLGGVSYVEEEATRSAIAAAAAHRSVIHLAAHAEARLDNPAFAHLKLADGQLSAADVFNLQLDGALVTLSACETGRSVVRSGDELIGLSRGFLFAGACTLVQSLWRVEDGSTSDLMERFYRGLLQGQTGGAALRQAQRDLLEDRGSHPFYWAAFQLAGDSRPVLTGAEAATAACGR
jgi:CHAT domain-containing protein/tetratricopeptide (TPR) repeat protein